MTTVRGDATPAVYDPQHLLGEVVIRLELQGVLSAGCVPADPQGAYQACRALLAALGVTPSPSAPVLAVAA